MNRLYGLRRGRVKGIAEADQAFLSAAAFYGETAWVDTRDIDLANAAECLSASARIGAPALQATPTKGPKFYPSGFIDGGPCLDFNGTSEYMTLANDMSASTEATVIVSYQNVVATTNFEVVIEDGAYFAGAGNGWTMMDSDLAVGRVYLGIGVNPGYSDSNYDGIAAGAKVMCGTYDTALATGSEVALSQEGIFTTPTGVGVGAGATGNWSALPMTIGARLNAGTPERYSFMLLREFFVVPAVMSQNDIFTLSQHMRYKAGLSE